MKRSLKNPGQGSRVGDETRKQLIRREMRFVLQQDVRQFTEQLLARLLDEGCNLHPDPARKMFYERLGHLLVSGRPISAQDSLGRLVEVYQGEQVSPRPTQPIACLKPPTRPCFITHRK